MENKNNRQKVAFVFAALGFLAAAYGGDYVSIVDGIFGGLIWYWVAYGIATLIGRHIQKRIDKASTGQPLPPPQPPKS